MFWRRNKQKLGPQPRISKGGILSLTDRYMERALHFFEKKKYADALADIESAIENSPGDAELYVVRGMIFDKMDESEDAEAAFDIALGLDDRQWLAHYIRGMNALDDEQYGQASEYFSLALPYAPDRPEILLARAITYFHLEEYEKSSADMEKADAVLDAKDPLRSKVWKKLNTQLKKVLE